MTGGDVPATQLSTLEGSPMVITAVFGRPFQGRFPLGLLSPGHSALQSDQGLRSDEASGFTPCTAYGRHFFIFNGSWGHGHGTLRMQPPVLRLQPHSGCRLNAP